MKKSKINLRQKVILVLGGLLLFLILLEAALRLGGAVILASQERRNLESLRQKGTYRILCVGESTTLGPYPLFLEEVLNSKNIGLRFSVVNKGVSGTQSGPIVAALPDYIRQYRPQMVVAMMGINDTGDILPYARTLTEKGGSWLASLRTYKLASLIWRHLLVKAGYYRLPENGLIQSFFPAAGIKEAFAQSPESVAAYLEEAGICKAQDKLREAESLLKKALALDPGNWETYAKLGDLYEYQYKFLEAETFFKKALALNPADDNTYFELAWAYRCMGRNEEAEAAFKKSLQINPQNSQASVRLAWFYQEQGRFQEARDILNKALAQRPLDSDLYFVLGGLYRGQDDYSGMEACFKKALEFDPKNSRAYVELGRLYKIQGKFSQASDCFEKAFALDPRGNAVSYLELAGFYISMGSFEKAEEALKEGKRFNPGNDQILSALSGLYTHLGKPELARQYAREAGRLRENYYNDLTAANYLKLKKILDKEGIKLVCVQYPMRGVGQLKRIFRGQQGSVFVDNEKIFLDAVGREGLNAYFTDMFAGDFGHCTEKGNRLLARNIAETILKEVFKQ